MKILFIVIGFLGALCAGLATPSAIIYGCYEWVGVDVEFKVALWSGIELWAYMLVGGAVVGIPSYYYGVSK